MDSMRRSLSDLDSADGHREKGAGVMNGIDGAHAVGSNLIEIGSSPLERNSRSARRRDVR
jgi:hypothetical protein